MRELINCRGNTSISKTKAGNAGNCAGDGSLRLYDFGFAQLRLEQLGCFPGVSLSGVGLASEHGRPVACYDLERPGS